MLAIALGTLSHSLIARLIYPVAWWISIALPIRSLDRFSSRHGVQQGMVGNRSAFATLKVIQFPLRPVPLWSDFL